MQVATHRDVNMAGLSDDQIREKKIMMKECETTYPHVQEWFRELVCDFIVRNPDEATYIRENKLWEGLDSIHSVENLKKLSNAMQA